MADDDRRSDTFIREVDEELRREQLKNLWDRFGWIFIGICVLIVAITAGYRGWLWWTERQAAMAGDRFMTALEQIDSGDRDAGEAALRAIAEDGGGYGALARLRLAGEEATAEDNEEALAAYDALSADTSLSTSLRDLAHIRAALLALDMGDTEGAISRAEPLDQPGNLWRHAAREVLGTAAYEAGDLEQARDYFTAIQQDAETPPDIWLRSGMMVSLIDGQLAAPAADADANTETGSDADTGTDTGTGDATTQEDDADASDAAAADDQTQ